MAPTLMNLLVDLQVTAPTHMALAEHLVMVPHRDIHMALETAHLEVDPQGIIHFIVTRLLTRARTHMATHGQSTTIQRARHGIRARRTLPVFLAITLSQGQPEFHTQPDQTLHILQGLAISHILLVPSIAHIPPGLAIFLTPLARPIACILLGLGIFRFLPYPATFRIHQASAPSSQTAQIQYLTPWEQIQIQPYLVPFLYLIQLVRRQRVYRCLLELHPSILCQFLPLLVSVRSNQSFRLSSTPLNPLSLQ